MRLPPVFAAALSLVLPVCTVLSVGTALSGCTQTEELAANTGGPAAARTSAVSTPVAPRTQSLVDILPGMPAVTNAANVYHAAGPNMLAATVARDRPMVYVPHGDSGEVWLVDPANFTVVAKHRVGGAVRHVVPGYDLRTLYALNESGGRALPFAADTATTGRPIDVLAPYDMYFTPDGRSAISVARRLDALVFYDPRTWELQGRTRIPACPGISHGAFSVDGQRVVFTCASAGRLAVVDVATHELLRVLDLPATTGRVATQEIAVSPDGKAFYVADSAAGGLWVLDGRAERVVRFVATGAGAHGISLERTASRMFVSNHDAGSISVLDAYTADVLDTWRIPGGGNPDAGGVSADGSQLWLTSRDRGEIYVIAVNGGTLIRRLPVGRGPHGLTMWPQPGRYSLGHNGVTR